MTQEKGREACTTYRETLSAFDAAELDPDLTAQVEKHVSECAECSRLLRTVRKATDLVSRLVDEEPARSVCVRILGEVDRFLAPDLADAPEIMTPEQLARFLHVPLGKLDDRIETIPGFEIGGELRFRKERVLEWIEQREQERERRTIYSQLRAV